MLFHKDLDRSHSVQSVIFNNIFNNSSWKNQIKMGDAHTHTHTGGTDKAKTMIRTSVHDMKLVTLLPKSDDPVSPDSCQDLP